MGRPCRACGASATNDGVTWLRTGAVVTALALALPACRVLEPPGEASPPPDLTLRHVRLEQYRDGEPTARVRLGELRYQRELARADVDRLVLVPLGGAAGGGQLEGTRGRADLKAGTVDLLEGVRYRSGRGEVLDTTRCRVDLRERTVTGPEPVTLTGPDLRAEADRFDARDGDDARVHLDGHVHAAFRDKPARSTKGGKPPRPGHR